MPGKFFRAFLFLIQNLKNDQIINSYIVYPIPTKGYLSIESLIPGDQLIIKNILGEAILYSKAETEKVDLNMEKYPTGVYFLEVNGFTTNKIIKY